MGNLIDSLNLRGVVIIEDLKSNKIILKKHNMILKSAKKVLFNKLLNPLVTSSNSGITMDNSLKVNNNLEINDITLKSILFGWTDNDVRYTDAKADSIFKTYSLAATEGTEKNGKFFIEKNIAATEGESEARIEIESSGDDFMMKFNSNIEYSNFSEIQATDGINNVIINSIAIKMSNGELFSRIKFDPIVITPDSDLKLTYYVYF